MIRGDALQLCKIPFVVTVTTCIVQLLHFAAKRRQLLSLLHAIFLEQNQRFHWHRINHASLHTLDYVCDFLTILFEYLLLITSESEYATQVRHDTFTNSL